MYHVHGMIKWHFWNISKKQNKIFFLKKEEEWNKGQQQKNEKKN